MCSQLKTTVHFSPLSKGLERIQKGRTPPNGCPSIWRESETDYTSGSCPENIGFDSRSRNSA